MKSNAQLSVAMAVYNEELNLYRCLNSISSLANEIVLVDGGSTDKTIGIAEKFGAEVLYTNNPLNFHENKQKAVAACHGDWILQLDADEAVSPELALEIERVLHASQEVINNWKISEDKAKLFSRHQYLVNQRDGSKKAHGDVVAFYIPRRNFFLGKAMTYAGMYPDGVIRLFKKGHGYFPAKSVHEQIEIDGRVSWLENDLYHYSNPTLKRYLLGASRYTNELAHTMRISRQSVIRTFIPNVIVNPIFTFTNLFIRHKGFLDGIHGFLFALFSSLHYPVAWYKSLYI